EAQLGADAHVVAGRRHPHRRLEVRPIDHLAGVGALDPEILGRLALGRHELAHAGGDLGEPALPLAFGLLRRALLQIVSRLSHQTDAFMTRALRTACARAPAVSRTFAAGCMFRSTAEAISSTSAEPTTTASATRATWAARSGVRTPKPTATGRPEAAFTRST